MPRQQFSDGSVRGTFLAQFNDDIFCRDQFLEPLRPAWRKFLDGFADFIGIKHRHITDVS
jgi:hypothetical protein